MISIIIPTFNEADQVANTIAAVKAPGGNSNCEIIVIDGGSTDDTVAIAQLCGATAIVSGRKGRAAQMNRGAAVAQGDILYFLHADSVPPKQFLQHILNARQEGYISGCFRLAFDYPHWFLKANAWFTRFDIDSVRFGDQSLFITKQAFESCGRFREDLLMMEDQEIIFRIKKEGKFKVMNDVVITSARKYLDNGVYRMQAIFFLIWAMYYAGYSQERLLRLYRKLIRRHKL